MKWRKLGLIYDTQAYVRPWAKHSALSPTPIVLQDCIRIYFSGLDEHTVGKIGYADFSLEEPTKILKVSPDPVLDLGRPGSFDDNGMILGEIFQQDQDMMMCYVGFQKVAKAKFLAFSGLALSRNNGNTFTRMTETPILDRSDEGIYIRAIHSILYEDHKYKIWYSVGNDWQIIEGLPYPMYDIYYCEATDLFSLPKFGQKCLPPLGEEYRIGRPKVYKINGLYYLFFTTSTKDKSYHAGFATSKNGIDWERQPYEALGITTSEEGFDSLHLCYPALFEVQGRTYMVYNGNHMGRDGFGLAILEQH